MRLLAVLLKRAQQAELRAERAFRRTDTRAWVVTRREKGQDAMAMWKRRGKRAFDAEAANADQAETPNTGKSE